MDATIQQEDATYRARITHISRGGCLVFPALPPDLPPHVKITFRLSEALPSIHCIGEILYSIQDKGTGIALTELSEQNKDLITVHFEGGEPT